MSSPPSSSSPPPPPPAAVPFPSTESESEPETAPTPTPGDVPEPEPEPPKSKDVTAEILEQAKARVEDKCTPDEDLRDSVEKLIALCSKLTARISTIEPQLTELQTSLTLTQSNLTLAMANTEMLEDALKHNSHTRDVGWRRSDSTASRRPPANSVSYSTSSVTSTGSVDEHGARIVVHAPSPQSPPPRAATTTPGQNESRFFRFRFGSKTPSPTAAVHQAQMNKAASPPPTAAHLTSASLPSLGLALEEVPTTPPSTTSATSTATKIVDPELAALEKKLKEREEEIKAKEESIQARNKELEELKAKLEAEKKVSLEMESEKNRVQDEIETLTQSLFEEANKMVADERRKMAEVEALLRETEEERDAVRGAMRVVEGENGRLRELSAGAAKKTEEEKSPEEGEKKAEEGAAKEADQASVKAPSETEEVKPAESDKAKEPEAPLKLETDKVESPPAPEAQDDAESDTDNAQTSFESVRPDSATKESSPIVSPVSSDDESYELATADEPEPSNEHLTKPDTGLPSLPGSSSDLWKGQVRDREVTPPKTPPRVHALPVETSPWAEGRA